MNFNQFMPFFPASAAGAPHSTSNLIVSILVYLVAWRVLCTVLYWAVSLLGFIGILWTLYSLICWVVRIYCIAGIVMSVMRYLDNA